MGHLALTIEDSTLRNGVQMPFGIVGTRMVQLILQRLDSISWDHLLVLDLHIVVLIALLDELSVHLLVIYLLTYWRQGLISLLKTGPLRLLLILIWNHLLWPIPWINLSIVDIWLVL